MGADRGFGSRGVEYLGELGHVGAIRLTAQGVAESTELVEKEEVHVDLGGWILHTQLDHQRR